MQGTKAPRNNRMFQSSSIKSLQKEMQRRQMQNKCLLQEELQELLRALLKLDHSISRILTDDKHTDFVYLEDLKTN